MNYKSSEMIRKFSILSAKRLISLASIFMCICNLFVLNTAAAVSDIITGEAEKSTLITEKFDPDGDESSGSDGVTDEPFVEYPKNIPAYEGGAPGTFVAFGNGVEHDSNLETAFSLNIKKYFRVDENITLWVLPEAEQKAKIAEAEAEVENFKQDGAKKIAQSLYTHMKNIPDGRRAVTMNGTLAYMSSAFHRNYLWWERGTGYAAEMLDAIWTEYERLGGEPINVYYMDRESACSIRGMVDGKNDYNGEDSNEVRARVIMGDPDYVEDIRKPLKERGYIFPCEWSGYEDKHDFYFELKGGDSVANKKIMLDFLWDRAESYFEQAYYEPTKRHFPNVHFSNYDAADYLEDSSAVDQYGDKFRTDGKVGNDSAPDIYGIIFSIDNYDVPYQYDKFDSTPFNALLSSLIQCKAAKAANDNLAPYIAWRSYAGDGNVRGQEETVDWVHFAKTDYYNESILHAGLTDPNYFLFFEYKVAEKEKKLLNNLLTELDFMVGFPDRENIENLAVETGSAKAEETWNKRYLLTGMKANGQNVWRITPDLIFPGITMENFLYRYTENELVFKIGNQRVTFPAGSYIYKPENEYSTYGYWVISPEGTYPEESGTNTEAEAPKPSFDWFAYNRLQSGEEEANLVPEKDRLSGVYNTITLNGEDGWYTDDSVFTKVGSYENGRVEYNNSAQMVVYRNIERSGQKEAVLEINVKLPSVEPGGKTELFACTKGASYEGLMIPLTLENGGAYSAKDVYSVNIKDEFGNSKSSGQVLEEIYTGGTYQAFIPDGTLKPDKWYRVVRIITSDFGDTAALYWSSGWSKVFTKDYVYDAETGELIGSTGDDWWCSGKEPTINKNSLFRGFNIKVTGYLDSVLLDDFALYDTNDTQTNLIPAKESIDNLPEGELATGVQFDTNKGWESPYTGVSFNVVSDGNGGKALQSVVPERSGRLTYPITDAKLLELEKSIYEVSFYLPSGANGKLSVFGYSENAGEEPICPVIIENSGVTVNGEEIAAEGTLTGGNTYTLRRMFKHTEDGGLQTHVDILDSDGSVLNTSNVVWQNTDYVPKIGALYIDVMGYCGAIEFRDFGVYENDVDFGYAAQSGGNKVLAFNPGEGDRPFAVANDLTDDDYTDHTYTAKVKVPENGTGTIKLFGFSQLKYNAQPIYLLYIENGKLYADATSGEVEICNITGGKWYTLRVAANIYSKKASAKIFDESAVLVGSEENYSFTVVKDSSIGNGYGFTSVIACDGYEGEEILLDNIELMYKKMNSTNEEMFWKCNGEEIIWGTEEFNSMAPLTIGEDLRLAFLDETRVGQMFQYEIIRNAVRVKSEDSVVDLVSQGGELVIYFDKDVIYKDGVEVLQNGVLPIADAAAYDEKMQLVTISFDKLDKIPKYLVVIKKGIWSAEFSVPIEPGEIYLFEPGDKLEVVGVACTDLNGNYKNELAQGESVKGKAMISKPKGDNTTFCLVVALYDKDGRMVGVTTKNVSAAEGLSYEFTAEIKVPDEGCTAKVFAFSNLESLKPICEQGRK